MHVFRSNLCLVLLMAFAPPAAAVTYCVDTATELQNALTAAAASSANDVIHLETGTYVASSAQGFNATLSAPGDLEISGGWFNGCVFRQRGIRSTIDGELLRPGLALFGTFDSAGLLRVSHMNFVDGVAHGEHTAGGLTANPYVGTGLDIEIESNRFSGNFADQDSDAFGGGLRSVGDHVLIRNNSFEHNHAEEGGSALLATCGAGIASFVSNTVVDNSADVGAASDIGGVYLSGFSCTWEVANNILWNNQGLDLARYAPDTVLRYNDLAELGGPEAPASNSNNLHVNPQFSGTSLRLLRNSPLVDAGLGNPLAGLSAFSLDGGPRVAGPQVDIGAYELDRLFFNGFDPIGFSRIVGSGIDEEPAR